MPASATETHDGTHHYANGMTFRRNALIAVISFLTLVDLFATQAILPSLARSFGVSPAAMGLAVNASTLGMAIAGIVVALYSQKINRRQGIWIALAVLAIPTTMLAFTDDLYTFAALRIAQGLCMSAAFTLTIAYLAEQCTAAEAASALAAYVTGNVASNLFGRLLSASVADQFGLDGNFFFFAALNLVGAVIAFYGLQRTPPMPHATQSLGAALHIWAGHFGNPPLRAAFLMGFLILFAFLGTFTFINFVLAAEPISLSPMSIGLVYFVFLPAMLTTPWAGSLVSLIGTRAVFWLSFIVAGIGLPLLLADTLQPVLIGLALIAAGTFFAQAAATSFVGRAAETDRGSASGLYLASYYLGGLSATAVLGPVFQMLGWTAVVAGIGLALLAGMILTFSLRLKEPG